MSKSLEKANYQNTLYSTRYCMSKDNQPHCKTSNYIYTRISHDLKLYCFLSNHKRNISVKNL